MEKASDVTNAVVKWHPTKREWEPDLRKPFVIQVLKKAVFSGMVDTEFVMHFKNSLAIMCEVWLRRRGIDPTINTSKNFHKLQDEFLKVLAHINRGFETEVNAEWKTGVGKLLEIRKQIEKEADPQWMDHEQERRKGDPASRYELKEEPRQDIADTFWVNMFKRGLRWKEKTLSLANRIDAQQSKFFLASFAIEEQKTFTETKITLLNNTQEEWIRNSLSAKLGLRRGDDFLEETLASSLKKIKEANSIITEGSAKLWLINNFFQLQRRDWNYLLGTLTGGHVALERLFGCLIATLLIGHDRRAFELKEDEAEELFNLFCWNDLTLPFKKAEDVLRALHQSIINAEEYTIFHDAATLLHALESSDTCARCYKSFCEAEPVMQALDTLFQKIIDYPVHEAEEEGVGVHFPVTDEKNYGRLVLKLELLLKMEMEIHRVVDNTFWNVVETFSDFMRAYKIQSKKELSPMERGELKAIANKYHLRPDETNFLMYAPDRCYLGTELRQARGPEKDVREKTTELCFHARTQKVKKNYITPPLGIRRDLSAVCGRYGKLLGDMRDETGKEIVRNLKMIWNPPKIQVTDLRSQSIIQPLCRYEIIITRAEPRKPREKWE